MLSYPQLEYIFQNMDLSVRQLADKLGVKYWLVHGYIVSHKLRQKKFAYVPEGYKIYPKHTDYLVSTEGEILYRYDHKVRSNVLAPTSRYYKARIGGKYCFIHRVVAETYLDNPKNLPQVNHKDGNRLNNSVSNLEWVSAKENVQHCLRLGLQIKGGKLSYQDVEYIRNSNESTKALAKKFSVCKSTINNVKARKTYK